MTDSQARLRREVAEYKPVTAAVAPAVTTAAAEVVQVNKVLAGLATREIDIYKNVLGMEKCGSVTLFLMASPPKPIFYFQIN